MANNFHLSCEYFPPHDTAGMIKLSKAHQRLQAIKPLFCSVTFGALGASQDRTLATVNALSEQSTTPVTPHISCVGISRASLAALLKQYQDLGIKHLIVLRGDYPSGSVSTQGDFHYACDLVHYIRQTFGDYFHITVAAYPDYHPEAKSAHTDLTYFKQKIDAGANAAITQYFYNVDAYLYYRDACVKAGITIDIIPGIMPINNLTSIKRFSHMCGAEIPLWLLKRLEAYSDDLSGQKAFALEFVTKFCQRLKAEQAPGLHFYTLNLAKPTLSIFEHLHR